MGVGGLLSYFQVISLTRPKRALRPETSDAVALLLAAPRQFFVRCQKSYFFFSPHRPPRVDFTVLHMLPLQMKRIRSWHDQPTEVPNAVAVCFINNPNPKAALQAYTCRNSSIVLELTSNSSLVPTLLI